MTTTDRAPASGSYGEQTTTTATASTSPPPLRRNKSSLRLLTELTRERIALRCDYTSFVSQPLPFHR